MQRKVCHEADRFFAELVLSAIGSADNNRAITALLEELNQLDFCHPETGCRFIYTLV